MVSEKTCIALYIMRYIKLSRYVHCKHLFPHSVLFYYKFANIGYCHIDRDTD